MPRHLLTGVGLGRIPARITGLYSTIGLLWIWLSDWVLVWFGFADNHAFLAGAVKGTVFITITAALLYWLLRREIAWARRSESLLRAVVEGTTDAVFVKDRDGRYLMANEAAARFIGRSVVEVLGRTDRQLFEATDAERLVANDQAVMVGGAVVTLEETLTSSGANRTYLATKAPYRDATGAVAGLIGVARDISERKATEDALRESDARLREAQRISRLGSWSWEPSSNKVWWSEAEFELFGVDRLSVSPSFEAFLSLVHPDDRALAVARVESMLAGADEFANDLRIIGPDGASMWIHSRARATRDASGALVRVEGTDQDVTAQRLAEVTARESEKRFQAAVEVAGLGVIVIDYDRQTAELSPRGAEQFGLPSGLPVARNELHARIHPDDRAELMRLTESALSPSETGAFDMEHRVVRRDGSIRWLNVRKQVSFVDGRPRRAVVVTADVTDRRLAEEALRSSEARYRLLFEANPHPMWVYDVNSLRFLAVNDAAVLAYGYSRDEFLGMTIRDIRPIEDVPRLESVVARLMPGPAGSSHWRHRKKDGKVFDVDVSSHDLTDGAGRSRLVLALDVTERLRAERELRAERDRFEKLMEAVPAAICSFHLAQDGRVTMPYASPRIEAIFGLSPAVLARDAAPVFAVIHADDVERVRAGAAESARLMTLWREEYRVQNPELGEIWVEGCSAPIRLPDGSVVWHGYVNNVTSRKQVDGELRAERDRFEKLMEAVPVAICSFHLAPDGGVTMPYASPRIEAIYGIPPAALARDAAALFAAIHPDDVGRVQASVAESAQSMTLWRDEYRVKSPMLGEIWVEGCSAPVRQPDGSLIWHGYVSDVTTRKQVDGALRESERRLRLALEAAGAISFEWDVKSNSVTRYFSIEPTLPITAERVGTLDDVRVRVHPEDLEDFDARLAACLTEGSEYRNGYRVVRPDGTIANLEEYGYLDRAADGSPLRLIGMSIDVTDRVAAIDSLRASEERLRVAAGVAGFGVFEHDHRAGSFFWSARLREIYGFALDAPADLNAYLGMIHPADMDMITAAVRRAHNPSGDGRFVVEHRLVRPNDGQVRWLATQSQSWFTGDGPERRAVRTIGATVDVTDAREAAEALRESEKRFRQLVDVLPESLFVEIGGRITYCNPAFVQLMGAASADELLGLSQFDVAHSDYHDEIRARATSSVAIGFQPFTMEMRIVRRDGRSVPVYAVVTGISESGQPAVLVVLSDLTERERAAELLRTVLGSVGDAILTIDERGVLTSANPAAVRQFGYAEDELIGGNVSVLMPEPYREEHDGYLANYLRTGVAKVIGIGREVECLRRDGTQFSAELTITEFFLDGERHFTGVLRDITERKRLQAQFIQAQKMEAVGRLAGGVAHDFNNLLTIISGYCELLMDSDLAADDEQQESVIAIRDAGERAARLTQQLLAFSRKAVIEPKVIDLNDFVTDSSKLLRRLIGEDIIFSVIIAHTPIPVKVDPGQLEQAIMNLVVNARDAMPTGGRLTIEATTVASAEGDPSRFARLSVSDTGHGMTDEVKEKIFEPFFTTKDIGKGTGLGLAVVHGVVTQSGGQIAIESAVGVGTTFQLLLPLVTFQPSGAAADTRRLAPRGTETILLVEDEEAVRKIARISLQTHGYTVLESNGWEEAIRLAESHPGEIHLLVSDVVMPEMGGRQVLDAVRRYRPGLRALFMSGYTDDAILLHGVVEATDAFIQKPFTALGLTRKVRQVIDAPAN